MSSSSTHLTSVFQLEHLERLTTRTARIDFATDYEQRLIIEAHAPNLFRVRCGKADQINDDKPKTLGITETLLARHEAVGEMSVASLEQVKGWHLTQGEAHLEIQTHPVQIVLYQNSNTGFAHKNKKTTVHFFQCTESNAKTSWKIHFSLENQESLYGLGETADDLNRRGANILSDISAHRALPLIWSTQGWGACVNTWYRVDHELGTSAHPDLYQINFNDSVLDLFLFVGEPSEILNQYTALTGRVGQPVLWAMGTWLHQTAGETITQTMNSVEDMRQSQIPLDAVLFAPPAAWAFQVDKPLLEWDADRFPNIKNILARFHHHFIHVCAPSFPGILQTNPLFNVLEDKGWLLTDETGNAQIFEGHRTTLNQPYGLLDLTYRDVYNLWVERHHQLLEEGLDAVSCSVALNFSENTTARNGASGANLSLIYRALVHKALFDATVKNKVPSEAIIPSTDLFPTASRYLWQLRPEVTNDWQGLTHSLRTALSLGNSGVSAQMHHIGSTAAPLDTFTPELYIRWLSCAVFSANFCFQNVPALLPWAFGEETLNLVKTWLQWRYRLLPYVLGNIEDAARTGLPVQRSMALSFPNDKVASAWNLQYLLGPALLVAPIIKPGLITQVYLPKGEAWWDLNTGYRYEGGTVWTMQCRLDQFPVFGREGHMLCLGPTVQHTGELNSARLLDEVWMFGMPLHHPVVMRNKIRVMQMQGSSYIKGLEGLRILPSEGLVVKRRGAEVRISRAR